MITWMQDAAVRYGVVLLLMVLDIFSGMISAAIKKVPFSSAKMASGMYKKAGTIVCLLVSDILYFIAPRYLEIKIEIQIYVFLYAAAMETLSIIENVGDNEVKKIVSGVVGAMKDKGGSNIDDK